MALLTFEVFPLFLLWLASSNVSFPFNYRHYLPLFDTTGYSLWAKDIIFIVSDGYLDGMHAWLAAYHGSSQSSEFKSTNHITLA